MPKKTKLTFAKRKPDSEKDAASRPDWKILVVDDEPVVLDITRQVLKGVQFMGRGLELLYASSGAEAKEILSSRNDIAVMLLDVVMESEDSGLTLVKFIRNELKNETIRIILRTGQPGCAPERRVIMDYDINDYREKTELTATRLTTSVISSLRNYHLIYRLGRCLLGMETVVTSIRELLKIRSYQQFSEGLMTQLLALLNLDESGLYAHVSACAAEEIDGTVTVLAGVGEFADKGFRDGSRALSPRLVELIFRAVEQGHHLALGDEFVGYIPSNIEGVNRVIYLRGVQDMEPMHRRVIETFLTNISIGFDTVAELETLHHRDGDGR